MRLIPRELESLWTLFTAPTVWALHFLACYLSAAIVCAKVGGDLTAVRAAIVAATLLALALIAGSAWLAWRQWGFGIEDPPHDDPTDASRKLFQGYATLLLSGLSAVAVVYVALPAVFLAECR